MASLFSKLKSAVANAVSWLGYDVVHAEALGGKRVYRERGVGTHPAPPTQLAPKRHFDYSKMTSWCCLSEYSANCDLVRLMDLPCFLCWAVDCVGKDSVFTQILSVHCHMAGVRF